MMPDQLGFYCSSVSWGGLEMNFVKCATWIHSRNYRVIVYCVQGSPIDKALGETNLKVVHVSRNKKYYDFSNARRLKRRFQQDRIKGVWLRDNRDISTIGLAKSFSKGSFKIIYQQAMQLGVSKKDVLHTIRFKKIDAWISLLGFLADQVKEFTNFPAERIHVVPLAVDLSGVEHLPSREEARNTYRLSGDCMVIGVMGRLSPQKGQHFLVKELAKIRASGINAELLMVGDLTIGGEEDFFMGELKETIRELELEPHVHLHPFTTSPVNFYRAIDIFIMASKGETFGTVTIEAMKCGVPVLGTNASGTPEILDNGKLGYLYEVDDSVSFIRQIKSIHENPEQARAKAEQAKVAADSIYSKEQVTDQLTGILEKLGLNSCQ